MASKKKQQITKALVRRLLIGAVILPPMVGVTGTWFEKKPAPRFIVIDNYAVIPGSPFYLDPNPNF